MVIVVAMIVACAAGVAARPPAKRAPAKAVATANLIAKFMHPPRKPRSSLSLERDIAQTADGINRDEKRGPPGWGAPSVSGGSFFYEQPVFVPQSRQV